MAVWIIPLAQQLPENWDIAESNRLWATPTRTRITAGDTLLFRLPLGQRSGRAVSRLVSAAIAAEHPRRVPAGEQLPWVDGRRYVQKFRLDEITPIGIEVPWAVFSSVLEFVGPLQGPSKLPIEVDEVQRRLQGLGGRFATIRLPHGRVDISHPRLRTEHLVQSVVTTPVELRKNDVVSVSREVAFSANQRESALVASFLGTLLAQQHDVGGLRITTTDASVIRADIFDHTAGILYEAKADATRENVRLAIGQLLDYSRFIESRHTRHVLLPDRPSHDLILLLESAQISVTFLSDDGFQVIDLSPDDRPTDSVQVQDVARVPRANPGGAFGHGALGPE